MRVGRDDGRKESQGCHLLAKHIHGEQASQIAKKEHTRRSSRYSSSGTTSAWLAQQKSRGRICAKGMNEYFIQFSLARRACRRARRPLKKLKHEAGIPAKAAWPTEQPLSGYAWRRCNSTSVMQDLDRVRAVRCLAPKMVCARPETGRFLPIPALLSCYHGWRGLDTALHAVVGSLTSSGRPSRAQNMQTTWLAETQVWEERHLVCSWAVKHDAQLVGLGNSPH